MKNTKLTQQSKPRELSAEFALRDEIFKEVTDFLSKRYITEENLYVQTHRLKTHLHTYFAKHKDNLDVKTFKSTIYLRVSSDIFSWKQNPLQPELYRLVPTELNPF